ncbi:MAG: WD40 repeat domain-containing protein [Candidatus Nitronauta litoralis]|uniref:WD40 repeat domain-containing protein n=1 Tax=Candidatus Nitronauta litoralis TaxID=2705533 RepID=A0A7T0G118_9BACT|nr:MAG: WD40 repeat domain-containing protein [Candidatus Nitronauta litoralis]
MKIKQDLIQQDVLDEYIIDLDWSLSGDYLAAVTGSGQVALRNMKSDGHWIELGRHKHGINSMQWHPYEALLASAGHDGKLTLWDISLMSEAWSQDLGGWIDCLSWSSLGYYLASSSGKNLSIWSYSGKHEQFWLNPKSSISDIEWSPDGRFIASTAKGGITIRGYGHLETTQLLEWHGFPVKIAWQPNGKHIAMGDEEAVHFWEVETGMHHPLFGYNSKVSKMSWSSDGSYLATNDRENLVIWDCGRKKSDNEELFPLVDLISKESLVGPGCRAPILLKQHAGAIKSLVFQKKGGLLASGDERGEVHIWNLKISKAPVESISLGYPISKIAWSPDGQGMAVGGTEGTVSIFSFDLTEKAGASVSLKEL